MSNAFRRVPCTYLSTSKTLGRMQALRKLFHVLAKFIFIIKTSTKKLFQSDLRKKQCTAPFRVHPEQYSKLRLSEPFQTYLFLFYEKNLSVKNTPKPKINNFLHFKNFCAQKIVAFVVFCLLVFVLLVGFGLICIFVRLKFFVKKTNRFEIVLITSIYYTTIVHPSQLTYQEFICTDL